MPDVRRIIKPNPTCASAEAGSFLAQLDQQLHDLTEDTRGLTPDDLEWQAAPGTNTIGMLLAHLAIVEVFWTQVGLHGFEKDVAPVLGIGIDDDGMPIQEHAPPPTTLAGKDLAFYDDLLARARAYASAALAALSDADLDRERDRTRPDGSKATFNMRWVAYHLLEHFAGHYGQVNLLRHQRRIVAATTGAASR